MLSHFVVDCIENVFFHELCSYWLLFTSIDLSFVSVLGVEIQCIGHFKLLFSLLSLNGCPKLQMLAVEVCFQIEKKNWIGPNSFILGSKVFVIRLTL